MTDINHGRTHRVADELEAELTGDLDEW